MSSSLRISHLDGNDDQICSNIYISEISGLAGVTKSVNKLPDLSPFNHVNSCSTLWGLSKLRVPVTVYYERQEDKFLRQILALAADMDHLCIICASEEDCDRITNAFYPERGTMTGLLVLSERDTFGRYRAKLKDLNFWMVVVVADLVEEITSICGTEIQMFIMLDLTKLILNDMKMFKRALSALATCIDDKVSPLCEYNSKTTLIAQAREYHLADELFLCESLFHNLDQLQNKVIHHSKNDNEVQMWGPVFYLFSSPLSAALKKTTRDRGYEIRVTFFDTNDQKLQKLCKILAAGLCDPDSGTIVIFMDDDSKQAAISRVKATFGPPLGVVFFTFEHLWDYGTNESLLDYVETHRNWVVVGTQKGYLFIPNLERLMMVANAHRTRRITLMLNSDRSGYDHSLIQTIESIVTRSYELWPKAP